SGDGNIDVVPLPTPDGRLRAGSPCINAGLNSAAPADDIDGELRSAGGTVDIGADEFIDTDTDGLPDAWELRYFNNISSASSTADSDSDLFTNLEEYAELGSMPNLPPIFISTNGLDGNPGSV